MTWHQLLLCDVTAVVLSKAFTFFLLFTLHSDMEHNEKTQILKEADVKVDETSNANDTTNRSTVRLIHNGWKSLIKSHFTTFTFYIRHIDFGVKIQMRQFCWFLIIVIHDLRITKNVKIEFRKTLDFPNGFFLVFDVNNHELSKLDNRLGNHW